MHYEFPHEAAFLPRTKLAYVNLAGILSDAKRDRSARVAGFVAIQMGERCFLVFLRSGEPFNAARLGPDGRGQAALSEVIRTCATESERGEGGQIGYFGAFEAQLLAMLSTFAQPPAADGAVDTSRPERLFPQLRERRFSGVVELCDRGRFHYLRFDDGGFRAAWFCGRDPQVPVGDFVKRVYDEANGHLHAALFPAMGELPVQAGPGLVDLFRRIIGGTLRDLTPVLGRETSLATLRRAQSMAATSHPAVSAFQVTPEGRISGDPVATPEALTDGVAAWLTEVLITASDHHGIDPAAIVERVARDSRFVLSELGFFQRLPWALAL